MSRAVLEAVPNFSEGRDLAVIAELAASIESVPGVEVVDRTSDPDHHRSVITFLGPPQAVEEAALRAARTAVDRIDLRNHGGVHPRIGALDVLPFVPLSGVTMDEAVGVARRVARRIAQEVGVPVYLYGEASPTPRRALSTIRQVTETVREASKGLLEPDVLPPGWSEQGFHPTAGAVCVGARQPLLAWNVYLEGDADVETARLIAAEIRESGGGFKGLRALGLRLASQGKVQVSMNLERPGEVSAAEVYRAIDRIATQYGAWAGRTEIIGLIPDEAAGSAAAAFWRQTGGPGRLLSHRLVSHLARRKGGL